MVHVCNHSDAKAMPLKGTAVQMGASVSGGTAALYKPARPFSLRRRGLEALSPTPRATVTPASSWLPSID